MSTTMTDKPRFSRGLPANANTLGQPLARPAQIDFLVDHVEQIAVFDVERGRHLWASMRRLQQVNQLTAAKASEQINALKAERNELRATANATKGSAPARPEVPAGRYAVDTEEGHLGFYHVHVSDKGFITVAVQASDAAHELPWKAALGVLRKIEEITPLAASIRYGKELGMCGVCGRTLTNEESRATGIGPICASRL
jgi:hypothetical protein